MTSIEDLQVNKIPGDIRPLALYACPHGCYRKSIKDWETQFCTHRLPFKWIKNIIEETQSG